MIKEKKYNLFKTRLYEIIKEPQFKEKINSYLKYFENDLNSEQISYANSKKALFEKYPEKMCICYVGQTNNYSLKILIYDNTVEYEEIKPEIYSLEVAKYTNFPNEIEIKTIKNLKGKLYSKKSQEITKYDAKLNKNYHFKSFDYKDYEIGLNGKWLLTNNFGYPLINCFITYEETRLTENKWIKIETKQYYNDDMKDKEGISYAISDGGDEYTIISKEKYEAYIEGRITEEDLFKDLVHLQKRMIF